MEFCLSTEMIDLHNQAPNRNQRECKYYWDEVYSLICGAGFSNMEIPYEPKWDFGGRSGIPRTLCSITTKFQTVENYMNILNQIGIESIASVHFDPSMFCSDNMDMYLGIMEHFAVEAIDFCEQTHTKVFILTATPPQAAVRALAGKDENIDEFFEKFLNKTRNVIVRLAALAKEKNIIFCLKNEFWGLLRGTKIIDYVKDINAQHKDICIYIDADTAHLSIANEDPVRFIRENQTLIGIIHFSDTSFTDSEEIYASASPEYPAGQATQIFKDLGQGHIRFPEIYNLLQQNKYQGTIVINAKQTRDFSRALLRARYYIDHTLNHQK